MLKLKNKDPHGDNKTHMALRSPDDSRDWYYDGRWVYIPLIPGPELDDKRQKMPRLKWRRPSKWDSCTQLEQARWEQPYFLRR